MTFLIIAHFDKCSGNMIKCIRYKCINTYANITNSIMVYSLHTIGITCRHGMVVTNYWNMPKTALNGSYRRLNVMVVQIPIQ